MASKTETVPTETVPERQARELRERIAAIESDGTFRALTAELAECRRILAMHEGKPVDMGTGTRNGSSGGSTPVSTDQVLAAIRELSPNREWVAQADVRNAIGEDKITSGTLSNRIGALREAGTIEDNGKPKRAMRYRLA